MRILLAALAGAVAMFVWTSIAHVATPLGSTGFGRIANEQPVLAAMDSSIGARPGLYFFPWVDPSKPDAMQKSAALEKVNPSGLLLYRPKGGMEGGMGPMLAKEFVKQLVQAAIWAWIASMLALGFAGRVGAVTLMGVTTAIATNVSYWNWYSFPLDYTMAQILIELVGALVAGVAIALVLNRRTI